MCLCFSEFQNLLNNNKFTKFIGFNDSNLSYNLLYLSYLAQADADSFTSILITNFNFHILSLICHTIPMSIFLYVYVVCRMNANKKGCGRVQFHKYIKRQSVLVRSQTWPVPGGNF